MAHVLSQLFGLQRILNVPPTSLIILISHNHPLCLSLLYPNTLDPTTNVSGQVQNHTGQVRILPNKFRSYRLSVRRPLTRWAESLHKKGGTSTNILFIPKRYQALEQSCRPGWDLQRPSNLRPLQVCSIPRSTAHNKPSKIISKYDFEKCASYLHNGRGI